MILFDNSLIKLDYDPATDILEVAYPDLHEYLLPEIKHCIDHLVELLIRYDVKRMLLDSSHTVVAVEPEKSREITTYLIAGLLRTRLHKLARMQSGNATLETTAQQNIKFVSSAISLSFSIKNFSSKTEASAWLLLQ